MPTGVGYVEADSSWFAVDTAGNRIEWRPYPKHWQMKVWNPDYQEAWVRNVTSEVRAAGWDGVFADNGLWSLSGYTNAVLQGTDGHAESDALVRNGVESWREGRGSPGANGKLTRDERVRRPAGPRPAGSPWPATGGRWTKNFAHWGTDPQVGYITDWVRQGGRDRRRSCGQR